VKSVTPSSNVAGGDAGAAEKDERVVAYLHMHVMALMVATLIERQLRRAMKRRAITALPLYPENRPCPYPTIFDIVRVFRGVERYEVLEGDKVTCSRHS